MNGSEDSVEPARHVVQTTDIFFWYSALLVSFLISRRLEERILPGVVICRSPSPALSLLPLSIYALLTRFLVTTWVWVDGTARIFFTRWEIASLHFSFLNTWKVWLNMQKKKLVCIKWYITLATQRPIIILLWSHKDLPTFYCMGHIYFAQTASNLYLMKT